jgi:organic radical activating enzyme
MKNNKFCPAPWYHMSTDVNGSIRPCCKFSQPEKQTENKMPWMKDGTLDSLWNGKELKKLRQRFIDGELPKECEICWGEENVGVQSYRQNLIKWRKDSWENKDFTKTEATSPTSFDFKLTNVCNMKCRICSPQASSLFLKEQHQFFGSTFKHKDYWLSNKIFNTSNERVFLDWLPYIHELELTGGEPLLSPENRHMLQTIQKEGYANQIALTITTNGKIFDSKFNEILLSFRKVTISLSIDDIEKRFEFHRFPSKWPDILCNIKDYYNMSKENSHIGIYLYCTISSLNVFYLKEYIKFFKDYVADKIVNFGMLHYNDWYSIKNLHPYIKGLLIDKYADIEILEPIVQFLHTDGTDKTNEFIIKTDKLDEIRGQKYQRTFPEWCEILDDFRRI